MTRYTTDADEFVLSWVKFTRGETEEKPRLRSHDGTLIEQCRYWPSDPWPQFRVGEVVVLTGMHPVASDSASLRYEGDTFPYEHSSRLDWSNVLSEVAKSPIHQRIFRVYAETSVPVPHMVYHRGFVPEPANSAHKRFVICSGFSDRWNGTDAWFMPWCLHSIGGYQDPWETLMGNLRVLLSSKQTPVLTRWEKS